MLYLFLNPPRGSGKGLTINKYLQKERTPGLTDCCFVTKLMQLDAFCQGCHSGEQCRLCLNVRKIFFYMIFTMLTGVSMKCIKICGGMAWGCSALSTSEVDKEPQKDCQGSFGWAGPFLHSTHRAGFSEISPKSLSSAYFHEEALVKLYFLHIILL